MARKIKKFSYKGKVWLWPGDAPWHFVTLDKKLSADIRAVYGPGLIRTKVVIGKTSWQTSLLPHKLSEAYLVAIKKSVRKEEEIYEGDIVKMDFEIIL